MAFFNRNNKSTLFPERQSLNSMAWTSSSDIAASFRTDSRDIFVIRDNDRMVEKIEKECREMKPALKLYFFNGHICYLLKDEQRLYDLIEEIKQRSPRTVERRPVIEEREPDNLASTIQTADREQRRTEILARMGLAEEPEERLTDKPATIIENEWSEEKLTEQLEEIENDIRYTDELLAGDQTPAEEEDTGKKKRKKRKSLGRNNQIMTRLTDSELVKFQSRVRKSGLPQGEYLRSAALTGKIIIEERNVADVAMLDELAMIRAELGRQGGLLKMVIKPNEGQRELAPDEWAALIAAVKDLETMKERVRKLEVIVNGDSKTPVK